MERYIKNRMTNLVKMFTYLYPHYTKIYAQEILMLTSVVQSILNGNQLVIQKDIEENFREIIWELAIIDSRFNVSEQKIKDACRNYKGIRRILSKIFK